MKASKAIVRCLEKEKITTVFGYPGAAICPLYDALSDSSIRHVLMRQEQSAGHAASGYARISGKAGVCLATSGPGATNLITAIASAYMDSIPLVAITGQVQSFLIGRDVFQEADITGACAPFIKNSTLVKDPKELPRVIKEAFHIARTGRPGPVLVDIPVDILESDMGDFSYPAGVHIVGYKPSVAGHALQIKRAAEALSKSERPVLCAGGGVLSCHAEGLLARLAERLDIPVIHTMMGVGVLPATHPLSLGMLGSYGVPAANQALYQADTVLIVGARVGDRAVAAAHQLSDNAKVIHIDVDPAEIGKNLPVDIPIVGDAAAVLETLLNQTKPQFHTDWVRSCRAKKMYSEEPEQDGYVSPGRLIGRLCSRMEPDGILVADVGQNQIWSANHFDLPQGRFLTSGGMGTMGYSLPAAIGASLAASDRQVAVVCGDGAFQMSQMELATVCQEKIPLKIVVFNNRRLGMIRELQDKKYRGRRYSVDLVGPDFIRLAQAYGIESLRLERDGDTDAALERLLGSQSAFLLECMIDPEQPSMP